MKKEIKVWDYANEIMKALEKGVLLTTKNGDKVNSMTIAWGMLGIEWGKPLFTAFVRENRFTKFQLEENGEFTVNIPLENTHRKLLGQCGTTTGKNIDKVREFGLILEESDEISVPGIHQFPLTLECRVIYKQMQDASAISEKDRNTFYPQDVDSSNTGANKDYHIAYYGEIMKAYIITE